MEEVSAIAQIVLIICDIPAVFPAYSIKRMKGPIRVTSCAALLCGVQLPFGLEIDEIEITTEPVTIDTKAKSALIESGVFVARISKENLLAFMKKELPPQISQAQLEFVPGKMILTAKVKFIIEMIIEAEIGIEIRDDRFLDAVLLSVDKPGPVAGIISANLAKQNPLFDIEDLPFEAKIESCIIDSEWVSIVGSGAQLEID